MAWLSRRFYRKLTATLGLLLILALGIVNYAIVRAARRHLEEERRVELQFSSPEEDIVHHLRELHEITLAVTLSALCLSMLLSAWLLRSLSRPISEMSRVARRLSGGDYAARVSELSPDEIGDLGRALNHLAMTVEETMRGLTKEKARVRELERMSREFVANASHELRTPLASISAFAEILTDGALKPGERRAEFAGEIKTSAGRLEKLVDELLDLSVAESGRPAGRERVLVGELISEAVAEARWAARSRRIEIEISAASPLPAVAGDRSRLKQVLLNLIDNAVKFNRRSGRVEVRAWPDAGAVSISVRDTGVGIPAEDAPRIFERFYRVDKARSRQRGGTGLGLSIAKAIVENHGGTIAFESAPGRGSTFSVRLPSAS